MLNKMLAHHNLHVTRDVVASCALIRETFQVEQCQAHSALLEMPSPNDQEVLAIVFVLNIHRRTTATFYNQL